MLGHKPIELKTQGFVLATCVKVACLQLAWCVLASFYVCLIFLIYYLDFPQKFGSTIGSPLYA